MWATSKVDSHVVCAGLRYGRREIYVVSTYFQYKDDPDPYLNRLDSIISMIEPAPMLIGADCNAHSTMWYGDETNERGEKIEDFLGANGLMVVNEPSLLTTFASSRGTSNFDVTIVSGGVARWVADWEVFDRTVSDHRLLLSLIHISEPTRPY